MIYALFVLLATSKVVAATQTAYVGDPSAPDKQNHNVTTLLAALQDPSITNVVLTSDYNVGQTFHDAKPAPLEIQRNVTVSGLHGVEELNMEYVRSAIRLCSTCTLTIRDLTLANARRGIGSVVDFVVGQPGSHVVLRDVYQLIRACVDGPKTIPAMINSPRDEHHGNSSITGQLVQLRNVTFNGQLFPDSVHSVNFAKDHPLIYEEGQGPSGGYAIHEYNVTRLCRHLVSDECLQQFSPSECVLDLTDEVLRQETAAGTGHTSKLAVAVAVPVALVGAGLLAFIVLYVLHRKRRKQRQDGLKSTSTNSPQTGRNSSKDLEAVVTSNSGNSAAGPFAGGKGWELTSQLTAPLMFEADTSKVQFGELLGAGSFGRVYKATWAGREVAVKVIEHDLAASAAVENEVQLMLCFNHPNIVRAYHCMTYIKSAGTAGGAGSGLGRSATEDIGEAINTGDSGGSSSKPNRTDSTPTSAQQVPATELSPTASNTALQRNSSINDTAQQGRHTGSSSSAGNAGATVAIAGPAASTGLKNSAGSGDRSSPPSGRRATSGALKSSRAETWLVQEYCDYGTLGSIISEWDASKESEEQMLCRLLLLQDCAQGLRVLHSKNVVHGDLNARNVLVSSDSSSPNGLCAKLADLGLSRTIKQHKTHRTTNTVGTMSHMPPELLRYGRMSAAVDIYAFGVMMWEVFTGQAAFKKLHYGQFFETVVLRNLRPMIPAGMPADYQLLMEHCWATEPADRPSIDRILECLRYMIQERHNSNPTTASSTDAVDAAAHNAQFQAHIMPTFKRPSLLSRQPEARLSTRGSKDSSREPSGSLRQPSQTGLSPMAYEAVDSSSGKLRYLDPSVRGTKLDQSGGLPHGVSSPRGSMHGGSSSAVDADAAKDTINVEGVVLMKIGDESAGNGTEGEPPVVQLLHQSTEDWKESKWIV